MHEDYNSLQLILTAAGDAILYTALPDTSLDIRCTALKPLQRVGTAHRPRPYAGTLL